MMVCQRPPPVHVLLCATTVLRYLEIHEEHFELGSVALTE